MSEKKFTKQEVDRMIADVEIIAKKEGYDSGVESCKNHYGPSKKTLERFTEMQEENKRQWKEIKSMKTKIDDIHKIFTGTRFTYKFVRGLFLFLAAMAAGIFGLIKLIKSMAS